MNKTLNKPLSEKVVAGVLTLVIVIVGVLAWKLVLAPPAPNPVIPMTRQQLQEALRKNGASVAQIQAEQLRLYAAIHPGWRPGASQTKGGYAQVTRQSRQASGQGK